MSASQYLQVERLKIVGPAGQNAIFMHKPEFVALPAKVFDCAILGAKHKNGRIAAAAQHTAPYGSDEQVFRARNGNRVDQPGRQLILVIIGFQDRIFEHIDS